MGVSFRASQKCRCLYDFFEPTNPEQLYKEMEVNGELETQRGRILKLLSDGQPHPLTEVKRLAAQYNARIYELRCRGFVIESLRSQEGTFFVLKRRGLK